MAEASPTDTLLRILDTYLAESRRCAQAEAYLAACVMLGSAIEGSLIGMAECFPEQVACARTAPRDRAGRALEPEDWTLRELIAVATELGWLPPPRSNRRVRLGAADTASDDVGDLLEVVRFSRNLVHPSRWRRHAADTTEIGERVYVECRDITQRVFASLYDALRQGIEAEEMDEENGRGTNKERP